MLKQAIPVLHVSSSAAAERFYCAGLGFKQRFAYRPFGGQEPCYMGLDRDGVILHVSSFPGDGVAGGVANFVCDDVDGLFKEFRSKKDVTIELEPTDQSWGTREMYVEDPDGNSLRFVLDA